MHVVQGSPPDTVSLRVQVVKSTAQTPGLGGNLELTVRVVNINKGYNSPIMQNSVNLKDYASFIGMVRENQKIGLILPDAVKKAIDDCIRQGILVNFLSKYAKEVLSMLTAEFNIDIAKEVWQEEAREEALEEAQKKAEEKAIQKSIDDVVAVVKNWGIPLKAAMATLNLSDEYRSRVEDELRKQGVEFTE